MNRISTNTVAADRLVQHLPLGSHLGFATASRDDGVSKAASGRGLLLYIFRLTRSCSVRVI